MYLEVKNHFQEVSKFDRKALNSPTQGTGCIILKESQIEIFNWVVDNGYFGKCLLCTFPNIIKSYMENTAAKYCKSVPIPAETSVGECWIH